MEFCKMIRQVRKGYAFGQLAMIVLKIKKNIY